MIVVFSYVCGMKRKKKIVGPPSVGGWVVGKAVFLGKRSKDFSDFFGWKVTEPNFWQKFSILDLEIFQKRSPNWAKIRKFDIFLKNGSNNFFGFWLEVSTKYETIFQKNLQFGDIWPQNCLKNSQIEVFGHFHHFASLVFLDFVHNDTLGWCLVVFLQFIGPVNVFLLTDDEISTQYLELTQVRRLFTSTVNVKSNFGFWK